MKKAYHTAKEDGSIGQGLDKFLTAAFHVGKRVRHETLLSHEPVSVASAAIYAIKQYVESHPQPLVVVVGAGDMCQAVVKHLYSSDYGNLVILNRTLSKALSLAESVGARAAPFSHLEKWLLKADVVITCVNVDQPIVSKHILKKTLKDILLVDIAVPRNVEESVSQLDKVTLIDMDSLSDFIDVSKNKRAAHVGDATRIIDEEVEAFTKWNKERQNAHMVKHLRESFDAIRQDVIVHSDSKEVEHATRLLLNKILHHPTMMIKSGYIPTKGVEMALDLLFGLRCPRVQFLQINADSVNKGECPFVDVMRAEGLKSETQH
jgi:glutamyl-tRNA reductase